MQDNTVFMLIEYNYDDTHIYGVFTTRLDAISAKRELGARRWEYIYDRKQLTEKGQSPVIDVKPVDAVTIVEFTLNETIPRGY